MLAVVLSFTFPNVKFYLFIFTYYILLYLVTNIFYCIKIYIFSIALLYLLCQRRPLQPWAATFNRRAVEICSAHFFLHTNRLLEVKSPPLTPFVRFQSASSVATKAIYTAVCNIFSSTCSDPAHWLVVLSMYVFLKF